MLQLNMKYCNLRSFSSFSLFKSIIKIPDLVSLCKSQNIPAIGLCEEMNMFGFVEFSKECKKNKIKPIFGCLLKIENFGLIPFFIKNKSGYQFLSHIMSEFYIQESSFIPLETLKNQIGLICLAGGENSLFYNHNNDVNIIENIQTLHNIFQQDLFIEIQNRPGLNTMLSAATTLNIPIVCTSPCYFLNQEDLESFYVLSCIGDNKQYNNDDLNDSKFKFNYIHNDTTITNIFNESFKEGLENSVIIAKKCNFIFEESPPLIPKYSEGLETDENLLLKKHATIGLQERLASVPIELHETYFQRLEKELSVLTNKNFSGYFLITADFVKKAKDQGIPVGPARGSGTGSLVAYALTITDMDPIKYDLIFERFLNPERNSMPDFDIDFCPERRKEVVDYLKEKYGAYNVTQIITFGTMQAKGVIRDVCRVFGIPFKEADLISRLIPMDQINHIDLAQAIKLIPELKKMSISVKYKKIFDIALKLEGLIRNFSKHAAGIIISDKPIWELCPVYRDDKGDLSVQFDLKSIEYVGGIKFDFLGLRTLTVIDATFKLIYQRYDIWLDWNKIPTDDKKTFELIKQGNLDGIFQFDGAGIRDIVLQLQPDRLEDLIVLNALYRPGPIACIPSYIKRKHGQEPVTFLHPLTKPSLENTLGIMVYQEQVMRIAKDCAGYSDGEADLLRRAMGKKKPEEMKQQRDKFISGALEKGISLDVAEKLFAQMNEFSGYGFNKSHSAPYAFIAYVCAYLKAHYPAEFLCCFLSEEMSNISKIIRFVQNIKSMNIEILKPCIQNSQNQFSLSGVAIRYGLGALKNLGQNAIENFINQRNESPYRDIYDFVNRNLSVLNKKSWEALVKSGALDCFGFSRASLLESLDDLKRGNWMINQQEWDYFSKLEHEKDIFGFFINNYVKPLELTLQNLECFPLQIIEKNKTSSCYVVGEISQMRRRRVKDKTFYAFIEIIDDGGILYMAVFSKVLEKFSNILKEEAFLVFLLNLEYSENKTRATAQDIMSLDDFLKKSHNIKITITEKKDIQIIFDVLNLIEAGNTTVTIETEDDNFILEKKIQDSIEFRKKCNLLSISIE